MRSTFNLGDALGLTTNGSKTSDWCSDKLCLTLCHTFLQILANLNLYEWPGHNFASLFYISDWFTCASVKAGELRDLGAG
jgi:hypothetical protein